MFSHDAKADILHRFYRDLLGVACPASPHLDLHSLVQSTSLDSTQAAALAAPFTLAELRTAVFSMNDNSSPGPDGFGPAFFQEKLGAR